MVPQCDLLEGNAKSFRAKIKTKVKNMSILLKKKTKQLWKGDWQTEADFGQGGGHSEEGFCLVN